MQESEGKPWNFEVKGRGKADSMLLSMAKEAHTEINTAQHSLTFGTITSLSGVQRGVYGGVYPWSLGGELTGMCG